MIKIAPSLLSADFANLSREVSCIKRAGADMLHLDVMDGHFVPNITFGPSLIQSIRSYTDLFFDAHLMIENPEIFLDDFIAAGVNSITIHPEAGGYTMGLLRKIKSLGCRCAIALNPGTSVDVLKSYLDVVDMVLVMTVNPGFGGQSFIESVVPKIRAVRVMINDHMNAGGDMVLLQVDGGINDKTAMIVKECGADILVAGSYIFNKDSFDLSSSVGGDNSLCLNSNVDITALTHYYEKKIDSLR